MMKFKKHIDVILIVFILVVMYFNPTLLSQFSRTILGKIVFLALIVCASMHNKITGLILVLLLVSMSQNVVEGLDTSDEKKVENDIKEDVDPWAISAQKNIQNNRDAINKIIPALKTTDNNISISPVKEVMPVYTFTPPPPPAPAPAPAPTPPPPPPPASLFEGFTSSSNELLTMQSLLAPKASNSLIFH